VLASGVTLWTAWEELTPPTTAVQAQSTDNETQQVSVTRVVDGDTIEVSPQVEGTADVRLIGVDTPEVSGGEEPCGPEASAFTTEQLEGQDVTLEFDEDPVDPYGRALAYVWVPDLGGELFNETLVREGWARVLTVAPNDKYEDRFLAAEREARDEGIGVWATDPCPPESTTPESTTPESTTPASPPPESTTPVSPPPEPTTPASPPPEPTMPVEPPPEDTMLKSGGLAHGPLPLLPGGGCPSAYPVERDGACHR
jgi:endonuclease YncB( thermonuclease family)